MATNNSENFSNNNENSMIESEEMPKVINNDSLMKEEKTSEKNEYIKKQINRQKRRSKNDCIGRDYVCGCGKTYLSYPALYTHIKTKHNGKTPEGTNANQVQSGRGRGRPRKNFLVDEGSLNRRKREINRKKNDGQNNELKDLLRKGNFNFEFYKFREKKFFAVYKILDLVKNKKDLFFEDNESNNDNNNNINDINNNNNNINEKDINDNNINNNNINEKDINKDFNDNNHVINNNINLNDIMENSMEIEKAEDYLFDDKNSYNEEDDYNILDQFPNIKEENSGFRILYKITKKLIESGNLEIKEGDDKQITCDESFGLFLIYISKYVKSDFFKIILILLKNYRDCMNILGWEILSKYKTLEDENTRKKFCSVKDPSRLPLIANEFLNEYLDKKFPNFDKYLSSVIIGHFNFWLFGNNLTLIQLDIINDDYINENDDNKNIVKEEKNKVENNNIENKGDGNLNSSKNIN